MAVDKDPSLAPLAEQHLQQRQQGVKAKAPTATTMLGPSLASLPNSSKPPWLRQRAPQGEKYGQLFEQMRSLKLATVCEEAQCPNIGECWNGNMATATIMLLGDTCTRGCRFCAVNTARTPPPPDPLEPQHTAEAVASWGVGYVVLTSVDRDDLADGGAAHFAGKAELDSQTVRQLKRRKPSILVECLTPDFSGDLAAVQMLASSGLDVFAHNVETVRDPRAGYLQTLAVLRAAKACGIYTKSSIMLGLGETEDEIIDTMLDLKDCGVDIFTLGQYLQQFGRLGQELKLDGTARSFFGLWQCKDTTVMFKYVASGPMVRSSYKAGEFFLEAMIHDDRAAAAAASTA
eukprot:gene6058-6296_t